jgi:DNA mismatch repair protein MutS2
MTNLDWEEILARLASFATSQVARDRLQWLKPLASVTDAEKSFAEISELIQVLALGKRPFMESLDLYLIWHQRLAKGAVLKTLELRDLRHFLLEILALKEILKPHRSPWITEISGHLMDAALVAAIVVACSTPDSP